MQMALIDSYILYAWSPGGDKALGDDLAGESSSLGTFLGPFITLCFLLPACCQVRPIPAQQLWTETSEIAMQNKSFPFGICFLGSQ